MKMIRSFLTFPGWLTGLIFAIVFSATCITTEKESRAWPILLVTPLRGRDILWGKFLGAIRRCSVAWLPLFVHAIVFILAGIIHPVAVLQLAIVAAWVTILLCSTGLYFSTRFSRTTAAVIGNLGLAACIWVVLPVLLGLGLMVTLRSERLFDHYLDTHPIVQVDTVIEATIGGYVSSYDWPSHGHKDSIDTTCWLLLNLAVYSGISLAFAARASARLRKNPFG